MTSDNYPARRMAANICSIEQLLDLLNRLSDAQYRHVESHLSSSCVGAHVRHIIDFYQCLVKGLSDGKVDYDARQRAGILECERGAAIKALQKLATQLASIQSAESTPISICNQIFCDSVSEPESASTLGRELVFLHGHTTHHFALIALLLRAQKISIADEFGLNPATIGYLKQAGAAGSG